VLKGTYLMIVIESAFCVDLRVMRRRETVSVVTHDWSKIMAGYNVIVEPESRNSLKDYSKLHRKIHELIF